MSQVMGVFATRADWSNQQFISALQQVVPFGDNTIDFGAGKETPKCRFLDVAQAKIQQQSGYFSSGAIILDVVADQVLISQLHHFTI